MKNFRKSLVFIHPFFLRPFFGCPFFLRELRSLAYLRIFDISLLGFHRMSAGLKGKTSVDASKTFPFVVSLDGLF